MDAVGRPSVRYTPGSWVALAGEGVWLLAETAPDGPIVSECWAAIEQGAGVDPLLGIILREGLRSVPSFALAGLTESGMRVLVEGDARAELRMPGDDSDATLVTADGSPTWTERRVDGPIDLRLLASDGVGAAPNLPLAVGVVLAAELALGGVRAESPARPVTLVPMPDPPIVAAEVAGPVPARATFRRPGGSVGMLPPVLPGPPGSPQTLQAPVDDSSEPLGPPPTLDHVVVEPAPDDLPPPPPPPQVPPWAPMSGPVSNATSIAGIEGPAPNPYTVQRSAVPGQTPEPLAPTAVPAVACPNQHLNPPYAQRCRVCAAPVAHQETFSAPRPTLGVLALSTGETVPLDRDVILGRAPFHPDADASARPHLVQLSSPTNDISRSHVRVVLEGWHVQVVDLGSINGTLVTLPGLAPVRLRAHDPFTILPGTIISIADEVTARFDGVAAVRP